MRWTLLIGALALAACSADVAPEQVALARAQAILASAGRADAMILAPLFGLDASGEAGLCGLLETPAGPVRLVVALRAGTVRLGKPLAQQRLRQDLGEGRFCTMAARARWQRWAAGDPNGLVADLGD